MSYQDPPRITVKDNLVQMALEEIRRALIELARDKRFVDVLKVSLPNNTQVKINHGLGREIRHYSMTAPIGASTVGMIQEISRTTTQLTLEATGYGATVTVDLRVW